MSAIEVRFGKSFHSDAKTAVQELAAQTGDIRPDFLFLFCSPKYDLAALGKAIEAAFPCPVLGCTTAGEILGGEGYIEGSVVCAAVASRRVAMRPFFIKDLKAFVKDVRPTPPFSGLSRKNSFAILLIDGLSMLEEQVTARINHALEGGLIPLVGASAGDGLSFKHSYVYHNGAFHENVAVLALFETSLPFQTLHLQHFEPTETRLVITEADPEVRVVTEINGLPAAEEYARALGMAVSDLEWGVFAAYPLILKAGGAHYVRSIKQKNPDGSLTFSCAVDAGIVLTTVKPSRGLVPNLEAALESIQKTMKPSLIFGSDCILRRLEIKRHGEMEAAKRLLFDYPFIGFSTYGEQFSGVHVNHSLTALALGDNV